MKYFFVILAAFFITGCGSSKSGSNDGSCRLSGDTPKSGDTPMELLQPYILSPGDIIIKTSGSESSSVEITHCDGQPQSSATLKEGSAIIRKP